MKTRVFAWILSLVLAGLSAACQPPMLRKAEDLREAGRATEAITAYHKAIDEETLTTQELDAADEALAELLDRAVRVEAAALVRSASPLREVALALAALQVRVARDGTPAVKQALQAVVDELFARHWPQVQALRAKKHYWPALEQADLLAAAMADSDSHLGDIAQLRREARDFHLAEAALAPATGALAALHYGLATHFGADAKGQLAKAAEQARATAAIRVAASAAAGSCAAEMQAAAELIGSAAGPEAAARLAGVKCEAGVTERSDAKKMSHEETVMVTEERKVVVGSSSGTVREAYSQRVCNRYDGCRDVTSYRDRSVSVPQYRIDYVQVPKKVTKEYVVLVTTRRLFYELSADVDITAGARTERVRRSVTGDVSDTAYRWPHGNKNFGPQLTAATARAIAVARLAEAAKGAAVATMAPQRIAAYLQAARASADPRAAAELLLLAEHVSAGQSETLQWLAANFGLEPKTYALALAGDRSEPIDDATVQKALGPSARGRRRYGKHELFTDGIEHGASTARMHMGFDFASFGDVPYQSPRQGLTLGLGSDHALLTRSAEGDGLTAMDSARWSIWLGGTTSPTYQYPLAETEETGGAVGLDLGYQLLVGVRTPRIGVLLGGDARYRYRRAGGVAGARAAVHPTARVELRMSQRFPAILTGWVGDTSGLLDRGWGSQLFVGLGPGFGVVVRWESELFDMRFDGRDKNDPVDAGERKVGLFGVGVQAGY